MVSISIANGSYSIDGNVCYTDSYVEFEVSIPIYIQVGNGYVSTECCYFNQSGVFLTFSNWQGHEEFLMQNGLSNHGDNIFYITVSDDKRIIPNSAMLESKLNSAVNKYRRLLSMIHKSY